MTVESDRAEVEWEQRLQEAAASFPYPVTPDIHAAVQKRLGRDEMSRAPAPTGRRRLAVAVLVAFVMLVALLAVPEVRAALARFLHVGAITIFVSEREEAVGHTAAESDTEAIVAAEPITRTAAPTALPTTTRTPAPSQGPVSRRTTPAFPDIVLAPPTPAPTFTPTPTATRLPALEGPMTLAQAEAVVGFSVRLPAASTTLEPPDIYLERLPDVGSQQVVVLMWFEPQGMGTSALVLYQIGVPDYGMKRASHESLVEVEVNGLPAYWIEGEHLLRLPAGDGTAVERLVGSVLVWSEGTMTYRLEGAPSLAEAVNIAESLVPVAEE
ncbi:MAG TPA: hypothetical protein VK879_01865 [Candidatus Sulfomarinibacteraceae bacterium]|nr:hypothetical protein [Candidatus Sulfomarinibacteraceae bacterium]